METIHFVPSLRNKKSVDEGVPSTLGVRLLLPVRPGGGLRVERSTDVAGQKPLADDLEHVAKTQDPGDRFAAFYDQGLVDAHYI